jgi:GTP-binding protein
MTNHGTSWVRLDYTVPARGLIGFRTDTQGIGIAYHVFDDYEPWSRPMRGPPDRVAGGRQVGDGH